MHTIEVDDETYASLEMLAKEEHASIGSVVKRAVSRLPRFGRTQSKLPVTLPHGYRLPVSEGVRPFTTEDVHQLEEELYLEGKA